MSRSSFAFRIPQWMADVHLLRRWTRFNVVGAAGVCVQLGVLALLVRWGGVNYLLATLLAVEAAILHNFVWHQRWTWRDRPAASTRAAASRLARFHLLNGAASLAGNLVIMATLTGAAGLDPILANLVAIAGCSIANFAAGTTLVFRATLVLLFACSPAWVSPAGAEPGTPTMTVWREYEQAVTGRHAAGDVEPFFALDRLPNSADWRAAARAGEATVRHVASPDASGGTIHHWVGAVFVQGVTLDQVLATLRDHAGQEERFYEDVLDSTLLARRGDHLRVYMKLRRRTVLTVTYNTEHDVEYRRLAARRAWSRSVATRIAELADAGTPAEREKRHGEDNGFLWRLNAYWRYEEQPGGVLIECESLSLSRSVPLVARPLVTPIANRVARESLVRTLQALRTTLSPGSASDISPLKLVTS